MSGNVASCTFPHGPEAPRDARRWVGDTVGRLGWRGDEDELALLVSEVVTNAVRYTADAIGITVYAHDCGLWVSVADDGGGRVAPRAADLDDLGGRGLQILDLLCTTWGVVDDRAGKAVWFELACHTGMG